MKRYHKDDRVTVTVPGFSSLGTIIKVIQQGRGRRLRYTVRTDKHMVCGCGDSMGNEITVTGAELSELAATDLN